MLEVHNLLGTFLQLRLVLFFNLSHFLVELFLANDDIVLLVCVHFLSFSEAFYKFLPENLKSLLDTFFCQSFLPVLLLSFFFENIFKFEVFFVLQGKFLFIESFNILKHLLVSSLNLCKSRLGSDLKLLLDFLQFLKFLIFLF